MSRLRQWGDGGNAGDSDDEERPAPAPDRSGTSLRRTAPQLLDLAALTGLLGAFTVLNLLITGVFLVLGIRSSANARTPTPVAARQTPEKSQRPVPPKGDPVPPKGDPVPPKGDPVAPKPPPDQPPPNVPPKVGQIDCIVDVDAHALRVSPDGRRVLAIGNTSIGLYDLEKGAFLRNFQRTAPRLDRGLSAGQPAVPGELGGRQ